MKINKNEWDFRAIPDAEVSSAVKWEYLRESDKETCWVSKTLNTVVEGKTIRQHFADCAKSGKFPSEDALDEMQSYLPEIGILTDLPFFPAPWLSIPRDIRAGYCAPTVEFSCMARPICEVSEREFDLRKRAVEYRKSRIGSGKLEVFQGLLRIDFSRYSKQRIVKEFAAWITKESKNYKSCPTGRQAQASNNQKKLKVLAVLRLRNLPMTYEQMRQFIVDHKKKHHNPENLETYPDYASAGPKSEIGGAFNGALKLAKKTLSELYPIPVQPSPPLL